MCQHRNSAGTEDQFHSLSGCHLFPRNKAGAVIAHVAVKCFLHALDIAVGEEISCKMSPGDNRTGEFRQKRLVSNVNVMLSEKRTHFFIAVLAGTNEIF